MREEIFKMILQKDEACIEEEKYLVGIDSMFDRIWKLMEAKDIGIIIIYGIARVGKTTLLNQIKNKVVPTWKNHKVICVESRVRSRLRSYTWFKRRRRPKLLKNLVVIIKRNYGFRGFQN